MEFADSGYWLFAPLQILLVDLLLGADNALVIGLACRSLPREDRQGAVIVGIAGAIVLRLAMTMIASTLLVLPLVKIVGAAALIVIALNLSDDPPGDGDGIEARPGGASRLWAAAGVIVVADAAMSLDNVVALAAIARGDIWLLAIGVALSLPALSYGGVLLAGVLQRAPGLIAFGAALLGWVAGGMAISDPLVAVWAQTQAPGLVVLSPALGAIFVFLSGKLTTRDRKPARAATPPRAGRSATSMTAPVPPPKPQIYGDVGPEPDDRAEPPTAPPRREDRIAIIGVLLLAVVAGAIIIVASYLDSAN